MTNYNFPVAVSGLELIHQGKTRDTFRASTRKVSDVETLLRAPYATDRVSTHNRVHLSTIPKKGEVLHALTVFWLAEFFHGKGIPNHLVAFGRAIYDHLPKGVDYPSDFHYRTMIARDLKTIPYEFIFRARMSGSFYKDYYSQGLPDPYGLNLSPGMQLMQEFSEPIFTPTEKSATDDPVKASEVVKEHLDAVRLARRVFELTRARLHSKGLEQIDGKFEIGVASGSGYPILIDEVSTPDSSRFCRLGGIGLGSEPAWLDKQILRDEAELIWAREGGKKRPLEFRPELVAKVSQIYLDICEEVTGLSLEAFQRSYFEF